MLQAAAAQTGLTLYGIADSGVRYASGLSTANRPGTGTVLGISSGVNRTSRFGFRGREDLGGGNYAIFNVESGLALDTGANADTNKFWDRMSYVGLQTPWGTVTLGRHTNLLADTLGVIDPLAIRFAGFNPNVQFGALSAHGLGSEFGSTGGSTTGSYRMDNSLKYAVNLGAVTLKAMAGPGEASGGDRSSSGVGAGYKAGAFEAQIAYMTLKGTGAQKLNAYIAGGALRTDLGHFKLSYAHNDADLTATSSTGHRTVGVGYSSKLSPSLELTLSYYDMKRSRTKLSNDGLGRAIAFLEYSLSKRSKLYAELDHTDWRSGYQGAGFKDKATAMTLGIVHNF
ncbi:porin [Polaromonas sp. OV174]|uniref:porin n=1 Tax=Polaromonas sp. OV174 TaxID=1855300 RepID=UPI000B83E90E|nr:porin [Polaromonas sp. OV174]